jgi:hypothetical protein
MQAHLCTSCRVAGWMRMIGASDSTRAFDEWLVIGSWHYCERPQLHILLHLQHPIDGVSLEPPTYCHQHRLNQVTWCRLVAPVGSMPR